MAFTSLNQFLSRGRAKSSQVNEFEVAFGSRVPQKRGNGGDETAIDVKLSFRRTSSKSERLVAKTSIRKTETEDWVEVNEDSQRDLLNLVGVSGAKVEFYVLKHRLYSDIMWSEKKGQFRRAHRLPIEVPVAWLRTILHLPGLRGHRDRKYPIAKVTRDPFAGISVVGPMHPYAASLLYDWTEFAGDEKARPNMRREATENLKQVNEALGSLGLTWKVLSRFANAAELDLRVGRVPTAQRGGAQDLVDIADVGFGLSQVLPVLVGLAAATPGQMVLIEQPELHLHPRAQLAMGGVLAAAANRGVIVVVETHSQLILRAIQTLIATGDLPLDKVGLHWFTRDNETGWSTVTTADLHKDGTFGEWPVDFPDVFSMADEQFIDAVFNADGPL